VRLITEGFAARRPARKDQFSRPRIPQAGIDLLYGLHLWRRQARAVVRAAAQERRGIEMAHARIVDETVFEAVDRVACGDGRLGDQGQFGCGDDARAVRVGSGPRPEIAADLAYSIVARTARNDAVVVFGITLRFGERLMTAGRAAHEV